MASRALDDPTIAARKSVLILEDEPFIAIDVEDTVVQAGFDVRAVWSSNKAATEWLDENGVDIAIIDVELLDGSCEPLARLLKRRGIPFVVHSGSDAKYPLRDGVFNGVRWVNKPSTPAEIVLALNATLMAPLQMGVLSGAA